MRITGGQYRNRKLMVPEGNHVRPTSDRMRQTLFNVLHHAGWLNEFEVEGAIVLDLFCGSGALGLEALSHGAAHCTFIDMDIVSVKNNTSFLGNDDYKIIKSKIPDFTLKSMQFNLVFMDPPYFKNLIKPTIDELIDKNLLADQAIIVIESEKGLRLDLPLEALDKRSQSKSDLQIFRYNSTVNQCQ